MKRLLAFLGFPALTFSFTSAQSLRYFEFTTACGHGNWQDTSFIAATSDPAVIDSLLADLNRPVIMRKHINGSIAAGNAGYNHNAGHWFKWHFIPGQWGLSEVSPEVCDGCPYSDVDADTSYWIRTISFFCPWSSHVAREVTGQLGIPPPVAQPDVPLYPNPSGETVFIQLPSGQPYTLTDLSGRVLRTGILDEGINSIPVISLEAGMYCIILQGPAPRVLPFIRL